MIKRVPPQGISSAGRERSVSELVAVGLLKVEGREYGRHDIVHRPRCGAHAEQEALGTGPVALCRPCRRAVEEALVACPDGRLVRIEGFCDPALSILRRGLRTSVVVAHDLPPFLKFGLVHQVLECDPVALAE
jgi:hypothetical protein